ncbi:hypothetical protein CA13_65700 [Planctomycetes bacterium CA13]|uniref:Uncharacterized protein n=1 Tax=Novipirellula herctigrandis TaxID=2527986 RepID=A0A5C5ZD52_9BACT|nr:hypothetical protein CA13_65700 [Planctomycetes bacterium CA13]
MGLQSGVTAPSSCVRFLVASIGIALVGYGVFYRRVWLIGAGVTLAMGSMVTWFFPVLTALD